jgi:hypothetical protein
MALGRPTRAKTPTRSRTPGSKPESGSNLDRKKRRANHFSLRKSRSYDKICECPAARHIPFDRPSAASNPNTGSFNYLFPVPSSMISSCPFINRSNTLTPQGPRSSCPTSYLHPVQTFPRFAFSPIHAHCTRQHRPWTSFPSNTSLANPPKRIHLQRTSRGYPPRARSPPRASSQIFEQARM